METNKTTKQTKRSKATESPDPVHVIREGAVAASVWLRQAPSGYAYYDYLRSAGLRTWCIWTEPSAPHSSHLSFSSRCSTSLRAAPDRAGLIAERDMAIMAQRDAAEVGDQWPLPGAFQFHLNDLVVTFERHERPSEPAIDGASRGPELVRQRLCQRLFRNPLHAAQRMQVVCHAVVLDESGIFRLVEGHDPVCTVVQSLRQMHRLATSHVLGRVITNSIRQGVLRTRVDSAAPDGAGVQTCYRRVCQFHHWTLGFKQSGLNHIAQALQGRTLHVFKCSPLYWHALVPSSFQIQVNQFTSESMP